MFWFQLYHLAWWFAHSTILIAARTLVMMMTMTTTVMSIPPFGESMVTV
jgi:hypothetical protein